MRGKWLILIRRIHLFLGVFFSPLLLFFIVTGWWQTISSDEDKERTGGFVHELMKKLSTVHTDQNFPRANVHNPSTWMMETLVISMCVALILLTVLGLFLAWKTMRSKWLVALALGLGIAAPVLALYFG